MNIRELIRDLLGFHPANKLPYLTAIDVQDSSHLGTRLRAIRNSDGSFYEPTLPQEWQEIDVTAWCGDQIACIWRNLPVYEGAPWLKSAGRSDA